MAQYITNDKAIQSFKETIIPGIFNMALDEVISTHGFNGVIKVSSIFANYVDGLESQEFLSAGQLQELDLLWVNEIEKFEV
jgi:hypothetical protein